MSDRRKHRLVDCNPKWVSNYSGKCGDSPDAIQFECPEGHTDCCHIIPFTPAIDGSIPPMEAGRGWQRTGDTFELLTLSPSIARRQHYASREAAIAAGVLPEYFTESLTCAFHGFVTSGSISFCEDSK